MIEKYSFGKMTIKGVSYHHDVKIINGAVGPDWRRNRGHQVDVDDLKDVLAACPRILVIGRGRFSMMKIASSLRRHLEKNEIELIEMGTTEAVAAFNCLHGEGKRVSAGFHLTC